MTAKCVKCGIENCSMELTRAGIKCLVCIDNEKARRKAKRIAGRELK